MGTPSSHTKRTSPPSPSPSSDAERPSKKPKSEPSEHTPPTLPPSGSASAEPQPRLPIFHPAFDKAEAVIIDICKKFFAALRDSSAAGRAKGRLDSICQDSLGGLLQLRSTYPKVGSIACLGVTGAGKSSAINSILGCEGAAIEKDSGRGTYVVQEYSKAEPGQLSRFRVKILYLEQHKVESLVRLHATNIISELDEADRHQRGQLGPECETAEHFFSNLLHSQELFASPEKVEEWFVSQKADAANAAQVTAQLYDRIRPLVRTTEIFEADTEQDLLQLMRSFHNPDDPASIRLWPLVEKIEICFDAPILQTGVLLADTPGVSDIDTGIVSNTEAYVKNADSILVFAKQMRIENDAALQHSLRRCIHLGKMYETSLVVTNIDSKGVYSREERKDLSQADQELLQASDERIDQLLKCGAELTLELTNGSITTTEEFQRVFTKVQETTQAANEAKAHLRQLSIEIRCRQIKEKLGSRLQELSKSKTAPILPIFFISNTQYRLHLFGGANGEQPILDRQATGVPRLLRALHRAPAARFDIVRDIAVHELPAAFKRISGVLFGVETGSDGVFESTIHDTLIQVHRMIMDKVEDQTAVLQNDIRDFFEFSDQTWVDEAAHLVHKWQKMSGYATRSFAACCRKKGFHTPRLAVEEVSLSGEIMSIYEDEANALFATFQAKVETLRIDVLAIVKERLGLMDHTLQTKGHFSQEGLRPLLSHMATVQENLSEELNELLKSLSKDINLVCRSLCVDMKKTYMTTAMKAAYKQAGELNHKQRELSGILSKSPLHEPRVEILRARLMGDDGAHKRPSVFADIGVMVARDLTTKFLFFEKMVDKKFSQFRDRAREDFAARAQMLQAKLADEASADIVQAAADEAIYKIDNTLKHLIEECEEYGRQD